MQEGHSGSQVETPAAVAALLDWWKLSGVDTLVGDIPESWFVPEAAVPAAQPAAIERRPAPARTDAYATAQTLDDLRAMVRKGAPFADGNPQSGLWIVGEAPSAEDLRTGRPFTGPAGLLLDRMLAAIGLDRSRVYITLLCPERRVPGTPAPEDIAAAMPLLQAHLRLAPPRLMLLLGQNPVQALAGETIAISKIRGQWLQVGDAPALATFNPAYLLRRPEEKVNAWADLLAFRKRLLN
ncbi:uracil-DNA glycosylase [Sandaracinobacteroides hominis]|uniref:uracil-DNA glycosylase n=1 Tax=Sandaracinobacteroides hominis TaxID=2780086 RepID=UPI0018F7A003|nr:uracil-DNA glycosylase [Sandaracinobacteroides hominis]